MALGTGPDQYNDTNSAIHQPPTEAKSYFGTPARPGATGPGYAKVDDASGTENLRADFQARYTPMKGGTGSGAGKWAKVDAFADDRV